MLSAGAARCPLHAVPSRPIIPSGTKWTPFHRSLQQQLQHHVFLSAERFGPTGHDAGVILENLRSAQDSSAAQQYEDTFTTQRRMLLQSIFLSFAVGSLVSTTATAVEEVSKCVTDFAVSDKVYFDISIDREPVGRIVVGLYSEDVPVGAKRFSEIAIGSRGISYRRKEFDKVTPSYIQNAGLRNFSLSGGVGDAARFSGGETAKALIPELEEINQRCRNGTKNIQGAVSIVVKDLAKPPPKPKLIAKDGKFEVIDEELRADPNGTQFVIATQDSPELDASNLVVGKVIDGLDVLKIVSGVRVVKDNSGSPYFKAAKLVGDTRAVVAERGFYRPYSKIVITQSGRLET